MKAIISSVIMIVFVIGGVVGADFLKNSEETPAKEHSAEEKDKTDTKGAKDQDKEKNSDKQKSGKDKDGKKSGKEGDKKGSDYSNSSAVSYFQFSRQFVVPVVERGTVTALVLMDINLEVDGSGAAEIYTMEPKLRDAVMRALMSLSHEGVFGDEFTDPETYDHIRETIRVAADGIAPKGVRDVLIMDIARQDRQ